MKFLKTYENVSNTKEILLGFLYKDLFVTSGENKAIKRPSTERLWMNRYDDIDGIEFIKKLFEGKTVSFFCVECSTTDFKKNVHHRPEGVVKEVDFDYSFSPPEVRFIMEEDSHIKHVVGSTDKIFIEDYKINDLEIKLQQHKDAEKFGI